jgi:hypothetical protein
MTVPGIGAHHAASHQMSALTGGQHKHVPHRPQSNSDVASAGATAARNKSPTGKIGNLIDMKA